MSKSSSLCAVAKLLCEPLEPRRMLATVDIYAAGATGEETMEARLFDEVLATFENVGGDFDNGVFEKYSFEIDFEGGEVGDIDDIFIAFTNDLFIPGEVDRNLRVDAIVLSEFEGEEDLNIRYETEAAGVYSTGTWKPEDGIVRGYRQSEVLHTNGFFNYSDEEEGSTRIGIEAKGSEGGEQFDLQIDGVTVETFTVTQQTRFYSWTGPADQRIDYEQVRIVFTNDEFDPANGIDRNLIIDNVQVGRFTYRDFAIRPEREVTVFSTGTWRPQDGVQPGIRFSDTLHTNGYFQFGVFGQPAAGFFNNARPDQGDDAISENSGAFEVTIFRGGASDGEVSIDYETRFLTADGSDFVPVSGTAVFADGVTSVDVVIPIIDDNIVEGTEAFEFAIFNPTGGAFQNTNGVTRLEILDNDDPPLEGIVYEEDFFGTGDLGWTVNPFGTDTADEGQFEIGFPEGTFIGNDPFQVGFGIESNRVLATGLQAGDGIGSNDVDGGVTSALSPNIVLPDAPLELQLDYSFAHTSSATFADQLRISVVSGGEVTRILTTGGDGSKRIGEWTNTFISLDAFAGQTIQLLIEAEDSSGTALEAAIGKIVIETV